MVTGKEPRAPVGAARPDNQFVVIGCSRHGVSLGNAPERLIKVVKHSSVSTG
jgi:hypothetical protein